MRTTSLLVGLLIFAIIANADVLFSDDFEKGPCNKWKFFGAGKWKAKKENGNGIWQQTAVIKGATQQASVDGIRSENVWMIARIRADNPGSYPEIGLLIDPTTDFNWYISLRSGDLVITEEWVAYHESVPFNQEQGKWYWMKTAILPSGRDKIFYGKVWTDGEKEPKKWMVKHTITSNSPRFNDDGIAIATYAVAASFDDVVVADDVLREQSWRIHEKNHGELL